MKNGKQPNKDQQLIERARKWAQLWRNPKTRSRMDEALKGLSKPDERKVVLCGQRISAGLAPRIAA